MYLPIQHCSEAIEQVARTGIPLLLTHASNDCTHIPMRKLKHYLYNTFCGK